MQPGFPENLTSNKIKPMKLQFLVKHSLAAIAALGTLAAFGGRAFAQNEGADPVPATLSGLTVSLSTSGYKFTIPADPAPAGAAAAVTAPASFAASATIYNRSAVDIPFTFPNPAAAERKFTFRVFDTAGALVWESDADVVAPQVLTDAKLAKGGRWSRTLAIPLKPGGTVLAPGVYTLEAAIDADKKPGAAVIFEVALPDPVQEQGINGLVLKPNPPEAANPLPAEIPAAGALVNVVELRTVATPLTRALFVWNGRTDDAGKFTVKTPAGRFRVTATLPSGTTAAGALNATVVTKSIEVAVVAGKFTDATVHLPAPPVISGIRGLVLVGPLAPVAIAGVPNEGPAAGARVTIDEILPDPNPTARAPFHWVGVTNREGGFQAPTPAGKFKVTATLATVTPVTGAARAAVVTPPSASAEVTVEAGKISSVTLHIDNGIR